MKLAAPWRWVFAGVVWMASLWLYASHLDSQLSADEARVAAAATALSRDWHDREGRAWPTFVQPDDGAWFTPIPMYAAAVAVRLWPGDHSPRLASAVTGSLAVLLIYLAASRAFDSLLLGGLAAVIVMTSPAHVEFSRAATQGIWHAAITSASLMTMVALSRRPTRGTIGVAAALIALSVYSQPGGAVAVPVLILAHAAVLRSHKWVAADVATAAGAAAVVLAPAIVWLIRFPSTYPDTFGSWFLHAALIRNPWQWAISLTNPNTLGGFFFAYWDFFSPAHLFLRDTRPARAGVFLAPVALLVAIGIRRLAWSRESDPTTVLARAALIVFVGIPAAAALFKEPRAVERALAIVPAAAILAAYGIQSASSSRLLLFTCLLAFLAGAWQFAVWYAAVV